MAGKPIAAAAAVMFATVWVVQGFMEPRTPEELRPEVNGGDGGREAEADPAVGSRTTPESAWSTAVEYQLIHSVALLALALYGSATQRAIAPAAGSFVAGIALFSGSLYLLALGGPRWLGPVTPIGGLCLIGGWIALLWLARGAS